jgi:hypothetical protein
MNRSNIGRLHPKSLCPHSPRGQLRYADRLRRPRSRWRKGQS